MAALLLKRIYDSPATSDGYRILIDRLWPRGIKKENAQIDLWLKDIAPSNALRTAFHHEPQNWEHFKQAYYEELEHNIEAQSVLRKALQEHKRVCLLYAAKDPHYNNAQVLKLFLEKKKWL